MNWTNKTRKSIHTEHNMQITTCWYQIANHKHKAPLSIPRIEARMIWKNQIQSDHPGLRYLCFNKHIISGPSVIWLFHSVLKLDRKKTIFTYSVTKTCKALTLLSTSSSLVYIYSQLTSQVRNRMCHYECFPFTKKSGNFGGNCPCVN